MIVVANLRLSGFFRLVNGFVITRARYPLILLVAIVLVAGAFSAFLVNDTICLIMTPLVIDLVERLERNPIPYLLAVAMASNAGSVATITGNPQNMIIGSLSHVSYGSFAVLLAPVAAISLVLTIMLIALIYRGEFLTRDRLVVVQPPPRPVSSVAGLQIGIHGGGNGCPSLRRSAGRQSGDPRRCAPPLHTASQGGEDVFRRRLATPRYVHRALCRRRRPREKLC